jgi:hypothetical protein
MYCMQAQPQHHSPWSGMLCGDGSGAMVLWRRGLLGVVKRKAPVNYQNHNQKKPKKIKMKTPSCVATAYCPSALHCCRMGRILCSREHVL